MEIKPLDLTAKSLLESSFYRIPRFQRPYSWDRQNVEDFWNDAVVSDEPDYFIGSFVLYSSRSDSYVRFVVDGQQRLTTITLLLAAVRDGLSDLGLERLASSLQKLIEREDIDGKLQYVLDSETPYPFLQEQIQKFGGKKESGPLGGEQKALASAFEYLRAQISKSLESVDGDTTLSEKAKAQKKKRTLLGIRDRVLKLQLITVELGNEDDAYLIFETMNTRGKDLTVSDLVKNLLTRSLRPPNKRVDTVKDRWNGILALFDESEVDINVNRFLHHAWLSCNSPPNTTEKRLFKEVKKRTTRDNAEAFLDSLVDDSLIYRQILEPDSHSWTKEEAELADSIRALNVFRVVQPLPLMLSLLRSYRASELTLRQVKRVLRAMENFHVQFTAVTSQRTGGGTAAMYAAAARQLFEASDKNARQDVLTEFVKKLRERVPGYDEFEAAFAEIRLTDESTRQRLLTRYLLRRMDESGRTTGAIPDYSLLTVEHIAPQRPPPEVGPALKTVGMLGNLLLVSDQLNDRLKNRSFADKQRILADSDLIVDEDILNSPSWSNEEIIGRTKAQAKLCYETVFRF